MTFKYLGDRECYSPYGDVPSRIRLTWNTIYDVTSRDTVSLTLNNLLDHKNYANRYGNLELPFNWRLSYSHRFKKTADRLAWYKGNRQIVMINSTAGISRGKREQRQMGKSSVDGKNFS